MFLSFLYWFGIAVWFFTGIWSATSRDGGTAKVMARVAMLLFLFVLIGLRDFNFQ